MVSDLFSVFISFLNDIPNWAIEIVGLGFIAGTFVMVRHLMRRI